MLLARALLFWAGIGIAVYGVHQMHPPSAAILCGTAVALAAWARR